MSIPAKVKNYLKAQKIAHEVVPHKTVYTAYDLAQTMGEKLNEIAKTLVVKVDKRYVLVVVPASVRVDLHKLKKALKAKAATIADEKVLPKVLKGLKVGSQTPFGGMHKLEVVADKSLKKATSLLMGAGSYTESLRVKVADWLKKEEVMLADLSAKVERKVKVASAKVKKASRKPAKKTSRKKARATRKRW